MWKYRFPGASLLLMLRWCWKTQTKKAMYISQDRADISFTVRLLSQQLKEPSAHAWQCAQRLACYLNHTRDYATMITALPSGTSILRNQHTPDSDTDLLLECFCAADWSGNKRTRRSMSSGSFYINGCCIYTSCKTNKHFDCTCAPLRAQYRCMFHTTALGSNHTPTDCSRSEKRVPPVVRSEWGRIV